MFSFVGVLARVRPVTPLTTVLPHFSSIIANTTRNFATAPKGKVPPPPAKGSGKPTFIPKKATPAKVTHAKGGSAAKKVPHKGTKGAKGTKGTPAKAVSVKGSTAKGTLVKGSAAKGVPVKSANVAAQKDKEKLKAAKEREKAAQEKERERKLKEREKLSAAQDKNKEKDKAQKEKERTQLEKRKEAEKAKKDKLKAEEAEKKAKEKEKAVKLKAKEKEDSRRELEREKREQAKKEKAERPKKNLSGYFFFANEARKDILAKHPAKKITEISQEVGKRWTAFSPEQKKKYEDLAAQDKERYAKEMKTYEIKHPRPPKRPLSSFIAYVRDSHDKVKQQNPNVQQSVILTLIGQKWKTLTPEQKKPYEKAAAASKEKYLKERKTFEDHQQRA